MKALTREVSSSFASCELTHVARTPIDLPLARRQHAEYCKALRDLGVEVLTLPEAADLPDSVFVEDTAVVLDEVAIIAVPGATSRRAECEDVEAALSRHRPIERMTLPATLDGGDVLVLARKIFVGQTGRTNRAGFEQLREIAVHFDYEVTPVPVDGCLHLKSAVTRVGEDLILINPAWVDFSTFGSWMPIEVDKREPQAANALWVNKGTIYSSHFPFTRERLEREGLRLTIVDATEVAKAEGAVTCCSILIS